MGWFVAFYILDTPIPRLPRVTVLGNVMCQVLFILNSTSIRMLNESEGMACVASLGRADSSCCSPQLWSDAEFAS